MSRDPDAPAFTIQDYIQVRDDDWDEVNRALRYIWGALDELSRKSLTYPPASDLVTQTFADQNYGPLPVRSALIGSGYLPKAPSLNIHVNANPLALTHGTLSPDTRPVGLNASDAYKQLFYATDYDHMYVWTGGAWRCIDYTAGAVSFFITAPTTGGWVLCNGSGTANLSLPSGGLVSINVPDLTGGGGVYVKGGTVYSGPTPTAAIAPGMTGNPTGIVTPFTPAGTVTGNLPDHFHTVGTDNIGTGSIFVSDAKSSQSGHVGDPWLLTGTIGGSAGLSGTATITGGGSLSLTGDAYIPPHAHNTSLLVDTNIVTGGEDQPHQHPLHGGSSTAVLTDTTTYNNNYNQTGLATAAFAVSGYPSGNSDYNDVGHNHPVTVDFSGLSTDDSDDNTFLIDLSGITVDASGLGVDTSGLAVVTSGLTFTNTSQGHFHTLSGHTDSIIKTDLGAPPIPLSLTFAGSLVTPIFTGNIGTLAVDDTGQPRHETLLPYLRL